MGTGPPVAPAALAKVLTLVGGGEQDDVDDESADTATTPSIEPRLLEGAAVSKP